VQRRAKKEIGDNCETQIERERKEQKEKRNGNWEWLDNTKKIDTGKDRAQGFNVLALSDTALCSSLASRCYVLYFFCDFQRLAISQVHNKDCMQHTLRFKKIYDLMTQDFVIQGTFSRYDGPRHDQDDVYLVTTLHDVNLGTVSTHCRGKHFTILIFFLNRLNKLHNFTSRLSIKLVGSSPTL